MKKKKAINSGLEERTSFYTQLTYGQEIARRIELALERECLFSPLASACVCSSPI